MPSYLKARLNSYVCSLAKKKEKGGGVNSNCYATHVVLAPKHGLSLISSMIGYNKYIPPEITWQINTLLSI